MIASFDGNKNRNAKAELFRVYQRDAPGDDAGFLHAADAFPAWGLRQPDLFRDIAEGEGGICLNQAKDGKIGRIKIIRLGQGGLLPERAASCFGHQQADQTIKLAKIIIADGHLATLAEMLDRDLQA